MSERAWSVGDALRWATKILQDSGSLTPYLDAELLLGHVLTMTRTQLAVCRNERLTADAAQQFVALIRRRAEHEPVAYLLGERAFYDVDLYVDQRVLIPRPETEFLVEEALAWQRSRCDAPLRIADVGTGSGALAVVLARHIPHARVWAIDISYDALNVAARNVARYGLHRRVALICGDLMCALIGPFDLIVANLPYIAQHKLATLPADVAKYEPQLALNGGQDGLTPNTRLLAQLPSRLASPGLALLEIDEGQGNALAALARASLPDAQVTICRDYGGWERIMRIERFSCHTSSSR